MHSRRRRLLLLLPAQLLWSDARSLGPARSIVLVSSTDTRQSMLGPWLELIYREALGRIGCRLDYRDYPSKRASAMADAGEVDGVIHRAADYGPSHPNLVRVEQPHFYVAFAAYAIAPLVLADGWQSLKETGYRVEYHAGTLHVEAMLTALVAPQRLSTSSTVQMGLRKLMYARTDLFIGVAETVDAQLQLMDDAARAAVRKVATMERGAGHAYLHKSNLALVAPLSAALAAMEKEGLIETFRRAALREQARLAPAAQSG